MSDLVLRIGAKLLLPFILLFALYVQFHGDYGPGGGFQAGVITAAAVVLVALVFGQHAAKRIAPARIAHVMVPLGVLVYAGVGILGLLGGRNFLDYSVLAASPPHARELGIMLVEAGVLITVAGTMISLFYAFADRER
jgi:multicomponent Na+:H+ antiporter subunit B